MGASSPISSSAEPLSPCPPCARPPRRENGPQNAASPSACPSPPTPPSPGQIVQLDTVYVTLAPGKHVKHFTAYDLRSPNGPSPSPVATRATAASAAIFLDKLPADMPFKVDAIQVDGGSEFMAEFEDACQQSAPSSSIVLPPKSPRDQRRRRALQRRWRYEFYAVLRPAHPPRPTQPPHRCLPAPLQHPPPPCRPRRQNPSPVPCSSPSQESTASHMS